MLDIYRGQIDEIDEEIIALLEKRFAVVKNIGEYKKENALAVYDSVRELQVLAKLNEDSMYYEHLKKIYIKIVEQAKAMQNE